MADLRAEARAAALRHGIDPDVLDRLFMQESGYQINVESPAGAIGVAQLMPGTAAQLGVDPRDPIASIDAAARLLRQHLDAFGSYELALAAYNAGPGAVQEFGGIPPYEETQRYVRSILGGSMNEPMSTYQARPPQQAFDATTVLQGVINAMPQPGQYKDEIGPNGTVLATAAQIYAEDMAQWQEVYASALETVKLQQEMAAGLVRMEDGTIVSQADFDRLDPAAQAQVQARFIQQQRDLDNSWADMVNSLGLTEFQTRQDASERENARRSTDFQNRLTEFGTRLGLDEMNQETAVKQVNRQLDGLQESRARAGLIQDALDKAAGWATGGKTSFTPGDFGQAMSVIAQFGGIAPDMPFLKFPGTRTVDPAALLTAQDQALGVGGPLPQIPNLLTSASGIPSSPQLLTMPTNTPSFIRPAPPVQVPTPSASPRQRTLSEILGMPAF